LGRQGPSFWPSTSTGTIAPKIQSLSWPPAAICRPSGETASFGNSKWCSKRTAAVECPVAMSQSRKTFSPSSATSVFPSGRKARAGMFSVVGKSTRRRPVPASQSVIDLTRSAGAAI